MNKIIHLDTFDKGQTQKSSISSKEDILLDSLINFFSGNDHIEKMLPIVNGQSNISLRILDWFITNYSKKFNVIYNAGDNEEKKPFNVYLDYKSQLKAYSKRYFDPFCRRHRIPFFYGKDKCIITTIGQVNFFRWAIKNNILNYVLENIKIIEQNMNEVNKKKISQKNKKVYKKKILINNQKQERQELSISATKTVNKHDVRILVTFE